MDTGTSWGAEKARLENGWKRTTGVKPRPGAGRNDLPAEDNDIQQ